MSTGKLILIGGGVRSGKSRFALQLAEERGSKLGFLATAQAFDDEMQERIANHKRERDDRYLSVDVPVEVETALGELQACEAVVLDCLTLWISNQLLRGDCNAEILARVDSLIAAPRAGDLIIVSNEVGMGVVPDSALGRQFRDLTGHAHQRLAAAADELYMAMMGTILRLHPAPLSLVFPKARHV